MTTHSDLAMSLRPILDGGETASYNPVYTIYIHTPNKDIKPLTIKSIDRLRDYNESIAEYMVVEITVVGGDFYQYVYPYKDTLEMSITYQNGDDYDYTTNRYKMVIINQLGTDSDLINNMDIGALNATDVRILTCQCIDTRVEALRHVYAEGIYRTTKLEDIIRGCMIKNLEKTTVNGAPLSENMKFDIYPVDNLLTYDQVIIPTGIKLTDLPSYLQNDKKYGLYNTNIGTFFQMVDNSPTYFIYPLYDTKRVESPKEGYEDQKRLVVVIPDTHMYDFSERTYMADGNEIRILAGNGTKLEDTGENEFIDAGDGYATSKPVAVMSSNVSITDSNVTASKGSTLDGNIFKERRDGVNATKYVGNNGNLFKVRSDYIRATLARYQVTWNHCNIELLYPGMPVQIIKYNKKTEGVESIPGVLQAVYSRYNNLEKTTVGILSIMTEKQAVYRELTDEET